MPNPHQCASSSALAEQSHEQVSRHWFAVYTTPRHERRVHQQLVYKDLESFLPLYRSTREWKKRCQTTVELPLFPSYLFVRIARKERVGVLEVPGVLAILGTAREPVPVPDHEVEAIRAGLSANVIQPHPYVAVGERARIKSGCLAGMEGLVIRVNNKVRILLTITQICRSFAAEVEADDVVSLAC